MFPWLFLWAPHYTLTAPQYHVTWNSHFFQDISRQRLMGLLREPIFQDVVIKLQNNEEPSPQQLDEITNKLHRLTQ